MHSSYPPARSPSIDPGSSVLTQAMGICRASFGVVAVFSGFVNLLQLTVSLYMMQIFDRVLATRSLDTLYWLTVVAMAAVLLLALLEYARSQTMQRAASWIEARVAPESFLRALEAQLRGRGYRIEALRDLGLCRSWLGSPGALALYDVPWVPVYLAVIFMLHPLLGIVALAAAALLLGLTLLSEIVTSSLLKKAGAASIVAHRRSASLARNAEVIDSMGMGRAALRRWRGYVAEADPFQSRAADRVAMLSACTKFARLAGQIVILGLGAWLVLQQELTAGASIAASIIMGRALAPVEQLIGGWKGLVQARQALRRLKDFLLQPLLRPPGLVLPAPRGALTAERLVFGLPGLDPVIKSLNFRIEPGESVAIIGPSASGKTTLVRMLIGTLPPSSGAVRLDEADVSTWLRDDLGRYLGYLPQNVELFDGSVFDNIARLGEAEPEAVFEAARLAGCHEMILRMHRGYDTEVGESGQQLSGGQRQLVGLARAMFGSPRLLVLDEPDSSLDGEATTRLLTSLRELKELGTTVVLVSHRPTLVQGVEKVMLLREGQIEAFGPRQEILARMMGPRSVQSPASGVAA